MATRTVEIPLSAVAGEATGNTTMASHPLRPGDEHRPIIVEPGSRDGVWYIVDGFHRVCGYVQWAEAEGLALDAVTIRAVTSDDGDLLAAAAEPGDEQGEALARLYGEAGL